MTVSSLTSKETRYVSGGATEVNSTALEWWNRRVFSLAADDTTYVVERTTVGRLDQIATMFYNNPRYWWVVAQYNNILDPYNEIVEGVILIMPSLARIKMLLDGQTGGIQSKREVPLSILPIV